MSENNAVNVKAYSTLHLVLGKLKLFILLVLFIYLYIYVYIYITSYCLKIDYVLNIITL